ncbi:response regulator transcription factor [Paenibacillus pasadenensis]|uniref:response regulator transcription factor n=1 Tax=Paenibacillus pasadenensis TaxID=217090 RepID=UPI0020401D3E|nr:response regulator transcription factor [Paenibacillus pasadenensis]MCM3745921.1 response regulator transcription factor [Paenibacillus pasadenensis]
MKRILIIEDEGAIAELQRDYLESHGFFVDIEPRGDVGLQKALQETYDLFVLDVMLPFMDGFEICRKIRQNKNTPILMISARKEDIDKIRGLGLGADDYMTKPFSPGEMVARVKAHLSRFDRLTGTAAAEAPEQIRVRGLLIDKTAHQVTVNGEEKGLTNKEFELIQLLASYPGRVFSKEELFERIWGFDSLGDIATVTVHIRRLREKIEEFPSDPKYIETVWGIGYRFKLS